MQGIYFKDVRKAVEKYAISRFKARYGIFDKRLYKCTKKNIKIAYNEEDEIIYIESNFKHGKIYVQAYHIDSIIGALVEEKNADAIFYDAVRALSKPIIVRNATKNNETYFGYVMDYLKDNYKTSKIRNYNISISILNYFDLK